MKKLGDVINFLNGKAVSLDENGVYPVYGSNGIIGKSNQFRYENSIIIGRVGAYCGSIAYCPNKFWASDNTIIAQPKEDGDVRFFSYFLKDYGLNKYAGGAAQPLVTQTVLKALDVKVPDTDKQKKIAFILSRYDNLIENNSRRIAVLEEKARRIYEDWFVNFRFPRHEKIKLVQSELGIIPEGWEVKPLEFVCERITDGSHSSPPSVKEGFPMASVKDMHDFGINIANCRQISSDDYQNLVRNDCKPKRNDLLIAKDGSYLKHIFVVDEEIDLVILSSIAIIRPNNLIVPDLLAMFLKQPSVIQRMKGFVSGSALPRIILKDFRQFRIIVPPIQLQQEWFQFTGVMLKLCRTLIKKNENLCYTRDLLLPKLISGEVDVSHFPEPVTI